MKLFKTNSMPSIKFYGEQFNFELTSRNGISWLLVADQREYLLINYAAIERDSTIKLYIPSLQMLALQFRVERKNW